MKAHKNSFWTKLAICCAGYGMMSDAVVIPLVNALFGEAGVFKDSSLFLQNFIISGNSLVAVITILLGGFLMKRVSKRKLLIAGTVFFFIGGIGCALATDIKMLAVMRAIDTASDGLLSVVTTAMILELWQSEKEQGRMFGLYNAVSSVFGMAFSIFAGYAALYNWRLAFAVNGLSIISVILVILFVPETKITDSAIQNSESSAQNQTVPHNWVLKYSFSMLGMFLISTIMVMFGYMMDLYIVQKNFGNSVVTGYLGSIGMLVFIFSCMAASPVLEKFKNKSLYAVLFTGVTAFANIIYFYTDSLAVVFIATLVSCFVQGWVNVYYSVYIGQNVPENRRDMCVSIYTVLFYLTAFASPYIPYVCQKLFNDGSIAGACLYGGIVLSIMTGVYIVRAAAKKIA